VSRGDRADCGGVVRKPALSSLANANKHGDATVPMYGTIVRLPALDVVAAAEK